MSWPFVGPPDCPVRYARLSNSQVFHAYYYPFGYPIRLCIWGGAGDGDFEETADAPTCRHCIKAETMLPRPSREAQ